MRAATLVALVGAGVVCSGTPARADGFWDGVLHPHAGAVAKLLGEAKALENHALNNYNTPAELPVYRKIIGEAVKRYQKAIALDPENIDLVRRLGSAAFDGAQYDVCADAYSHAIELAGALTDGEQIRRLAESQVQLGRYDDAVETLVRGVEAVPEESRAALYDVLGKAYMAEGRLEDAIDAYKSSNRLGSDTAAYLFALAVAYDRDEQVLATDQTLEDVRSLDDAFGFIVTTDMSTMPTMLFAPAADRHYWLALAYEAVKPAELPEAAAEWRAYLDSADPLYRRRAEEHLKSVQDELAKKGKHR